MNKRVFARLWIACLLLSACSFGGDTVNYTDQREQREFTGIVFLEVREDGMDVRLLPSGNDTLYVDVRIDRMSIRGIDPENLKSPFTFKRKDGRLVVEPTYGGKVRESHGLVTVKVPSGVEEISVKTGKGDIRAQGLKVRSLELVSTQGKADAGDCQGCEDMRVSSFK